MKKASQMCETYNIFTPGVFFIAVTSTHFEIFSAFFEFLNIINPESFICSISRLYLQDVRHYVKFLPEFSFNLEFFWGE